MKKLRDDWQNVAMGRQRVETDVFSAADRDRENDDRRRLYEEALADQSEKKAPENLPDEKSLDS